MSAPSSPLRLVGRDVLFVHWPVPVDAVREVVPGPLTVDTVDGSAWLSVLAHEVEGTTLGPVPVSRPFVQVNLRTYVRFDGDPGVYFLSLDAGNRAAAGAGRRLFGLPFSPARGVGPPPRRRDRRPPQSADGPWTAAGPLRRPVPTDERADDAPGPARAVAGAGRDGTDVLVGEVTRDPWRLAPVDPTVRTNTLFDADGLDPPDTEPTVEYSPGYESSVVGVESVPSEG